MLTGSQYRINLIFSGILMFGGLALIFFGRDVLKEAKISKQWPIASGEVQSVSLKPGVSSSKNNPEYHYTISYVYEVDGQLYQGDRHSLGEGTTASEKFPNENEAIAAAQRDYPVGRKIEVYYNPQKPGVAVLKPGVNFSAYIPFVLGFVMLPSGVILLIVTISSSIK
ncbi:MAG: DUF3592 domain-containing protein [Limnothrix sp.]